MAAIQELLVLHHTHTDIGYTHPQPVLLELQNRFIEEALDLCEATRDWDEPSRVRWTCEVTAPLLRWLGEAKPDQLRRFRECVAAGQISAGAMACNGTPLYTGAQLAGTLEPLRRLREEFGLPMRAAINHDINGVPWPLTQLLLNCGVELLIMGINVFFGGFPLHRPLLFRWRGADGRSLLAFNSEHYQSFDRELRVGQESTDAMAEGLAAYTTRVQAAGYRHDFLLLSATNPGFPDNNPPRPATAEMIRRWNAEGRFPVIRYATPEMLIERIHRQPADTIPVHTGDWTDFWNFGCGSSARETRINRASKTRLFGSQALGLAFNGPSSLREHELRTEAWANANLYDEHTWGSDPSVAGSDRDGVAEQWAHKASYAWRGRSLSTLLMRDALEKAAGNPSQANGLEGVLFYNPAPVPVTICPRVSTSWLDGRWSHFSSTVHSLDVLGEAPADGTECRVGPITLPAMGLRVIPIRELKPASFPGCRVEGGLLESPYFQLRFDPKTGRIQSLRNRANQRELVDTGSPWPFFAIVSESVPPEETATEFGGREALFSFDWERIHRGERGWKPGWPAVRALPQGTPTLSTACDAQGVSLILRWPDSSVLENVEQRVRLLAHRAAVELSVSYRKPDIRTPESQYLVFPLALDAWEGWYDTGNLPVRLDREQLPGSCRDSITVGSYAAMTDEHQAVTLACPDAPMVQFGDFHFGKGLRSVPRTPRPLLLAWLNNNYWHTNFRASQPGDLRFRFELSASDRFDPLAAAQAGALAQARLEIHPVIRAPQEREEICIAVEGALLLEARRDEANPQRVVVRLVNVREEPVKAQVRLPGAIRHAHLASEDPQAEFPLVIVDGTLHAELPARRLATLHLDL